MAKKYAESSEKKPASSVKESTSTEKVSNDSHFASPEMVEKALNHVMKVHGEAFQKLAK